MNTVLWVTRWGTSTSPNMLNQTGILGICRPGGYLELFVRFLGSLLSSFCSGEWYIVLLGGGTAIWEWHHHERGYLVCNRVWVVCVNRHQHECQDTMFPNRALQDDQCSPHQSVVLMFDWLVEGFWGALAQVTDAVALFERTVSVKQNEKSLPTLTFWVQHNKNPKSALLSPVVQFIVSHILFDHVCLVTPAWIVLWTIELLKKITASHVPSPFSWYQSMPCGIRLFWNAPSDLFSSFLLLVLV